MNEIDIKEFLNYSNQFLKDNIEEKVLIEVRKINNWKVKREMIIYRILCLFTFIIAFSLLIIFLLVNSLDDYFLLFIAFIILMIILSYSEFFNAPRNLSNEH